MTLPNFLIIGAMKAGTTSLYRDLLTNPAVFMPLDKEPESLARDEVITEAGRAAYEALFAPAKPAHAARGEASTAYTKLPDFAGVPARARALLGRDLKCIYLVREPVSRIVSHHHHNVSAGIFTITDVNAAVREYPELLNWTRYAMQARPWIDAFGAGNVRIIPFERYTKERRACVADLSAWLGVPPRPDLVDIEAVYNRSEGKPVITEGWKRIRLSGAYRRVLRPLLPTPVRDRLRQMLFPKAPERPAPPTPATVDWVYDQLSADLADLRSIMGAAARVWDRAAVRASFNPTGAT